MASSRSTVEASSVAYHAEGSVGVNETKTAEGTQVRMKARRSQ
jgi:hypothetical protein